MALTLFARRPEPVEAPAPDPWPEIGETWKPEGVTIAQRYYNQAHAVVLVYTPDDDKTGHCYTVACLGCHFASAYGGKPTYTPYGLAQAATVANEHATTCRALPRTLPARPDDDTVREQLHAWVNDNRRYATNQLWLSSLDLRRLTMQRTTAWIENVLQQLAADQPDVLRIERSSHSGYVSYYARSKPKN
ncbi:hypothetical protein OG599_34755 (plasmid) [Streptomyces sp. NBC_01335]|uniref:hypothetical protein n=1 Tax=Streptomyces sp. NBC_01335 TaxID=2903828 RepID=UPI002E126E13|nr:hypothetical protein OG599_34755 [Streptomyces sp. NBC_01335]